MTGGQRRRRDNKTDDVEADRARRRDSRVAEAVEVRAYGLPHEPRGLRSRSYPPDPRRAFRPGRGQFLWGNQISGAFHLTHWLLSTQVRTATSAVDAVIVCLQSPTTTRDPTSV